VLTLIFQNVSKTRQRSARQPRLPDGPVWVRTYPVTFLHDQVSERHRHDWHQLTYAVRGHLEVITDDARRIVPADRAVWVPAGVDHVEVMRAPVSMRSIYVAPAALRKKPGGCRTVAVTPLLRELVLHVSRIGALDRRDAEQARLAGVLLDLLATAEDVPLELRSPRDPRARRFAELVASDPGDDTPLAKLARAVGSSVRTLERRFVAETGVDWISVAIGNTAVADGDGAIAAAGSFNALFGVVAAVGNSAHANGDGSVAIAGSGDLSPTGVVLAIGNNATANGTGAIALAGSFTNGGIDNTATATASSGSIALAAAGSG